MTHEHEDLDPELIEMAKRIARETKIDIQEAINSLGEAGAIEAAGKYLLKKSREFSTFGPRSEAKRFKALAKDALSEAQSMREAGAEDLNGEPN